MDVLKLEELIYCGLEKQVGQVSILTKIIAQLI